MKSLPRLMITGCLISLGAFSTCVRDALAGGNQALPAIRDNTLFEYDPDDPSFSLNSNGQGDFFSAGRTFNRNLIRRGLLQFDLSALPPTARVVPGSAVLHLYVVNTPRQDAAPRPVWLTPALQAWGEGTSLVNNGASGSGSGTPAGLGDATWFHTAYDPAVHLGAPFQSGSPGYWDLPGALGDAPLDPATLFGTPAATVLSQVGPVELTGRALEGDLNAWLQGATNFGWLVLGDETVASSTAGSLRGFASREHLNESFRPRLEFQYRLADLNGDDAVDAADASILFELWGSANPQGDIVVDQVVDAADAGLLFEEWSGDGLSVQFVPEPCALKATSLLLVAGLAWRRHAMNQSWQRCR